MKVKRLCEICGCIESRIKWYEKAIAMASGKIMWDNHFDWPMDGSASQDASRIQKWRGAIYELKNTLNMLRDGA